MNPLTLLEVFGNRPDRLDTLEILVRECGADASFVVLEAGCGAGDGIAHLCKTLRCRGIGLDSDGDVLLRAAKHYRETSSLTFVAGSVYAIAQKNSCCDVVVSEAAFSLLEDKTRAAREYHRVLRTGGKLLLRDFASMEAVEQADRSAIDHIPCFNRVGTLFDYEAILRTAGFRTVRKELSSKELIKISLYLSRTFGVKLTEISQLFARLMNADCGKGESGQRFFRNNKLGYCLLIAENC